MAKWRQVLLGFVLLLPSLALANTGTNNNIAENFIQSLFGQSFTQGSVLTSIISVFNGVILTVAIGFFLYALILGIVTTATSGKFLGERGNTPWYAIRVIGGFALLLPNAQGIATIQILLLKVVLLGSQLGDGLWRDTYGYAQENGFFYCG